MQVLLQVTVTLLVMLEFRKSRFLHPLTKTRQSYCIKLVCLNIFPALL